MCLSWSFDFVFTKLLKNDAEIYSSATALNKIKYLTWITKSVNRNPMLIQSFSLFILFQNIFNKFTECWWTSFLLAGIHKRGRPYMTSRSLTGRRSWIVLWHYYGCSSKMRDDGLVGGQKLSKKLRDVIYGRALSCINVIKP